MEFGFKKKHLILFLALLLSIVFTACGPSIPPETTLHSEAIKLFKEKNYEGAIEKFLATIEANPDLLKTYGNLSLMYIKLDTPDYTNALKYIKDGLVKATELEDEKKIKTYTKTFNKRAKAYYENVVKPEATTETLQAFATEYPEAAETFGVIAILEEKAYEEVKQADTIEAYEEYIANNPESAFLEDAQKVIFDKTMESNDPGLIQNYLDDNPDSEKKEEIAKKLAGLEFDKVDAMPEGTDKVKALEDFIAKYPKSEFSKTAKSKIAAGEWSKASKANSVKALEEFITKFPDTKFTKEAGKKIDAIRFSEVKGHLTTAKTPEDKIKVYEEFISKYPKNRFVKRVKEAITKLKKGAAKSDAAKKSTPAPAPVKKKSDSPKPMPDVPFIP